MDWRHRNATLSRGVWPVISALIISLTLCWIAVAQETGGSIFIEGTTDDLAAYVRDGRQIYDRTCAYCHGLDGKGNGPVASLLSVRPRNFVEGVYKFRTTESGSLPTDFDLFRSITVGVHGTEMLAWRDLPEVQRWQLVAYLKSLSPRFDDEEPVPMEFAPPVQADQYSIERGRALFVKAKCWECHGLGGLGDGPSVSTLKDDDGNSIIPRNLTTGANFGRGSDPGSINRVLMTGIDGTPMPSYWGAFPDSALWDLANYVSFIAGKD